MLLEMFSMGACKARAQTAQNARLVRAVEADELAEVEAALAQGASPNALRENAMPVACIAAFHGKTAILKTLLDHGALPDARASDHKSILMEAASSAQADTVRLALSRGVKVNLQDDEGRSALMLVGRRDCLKLLLNAGADKELRDRRGRTALMVYAEDGITEGVECLVDAGARVNARDSRGNTPLIIASDWAYGDTGGSPKNWRDIVEYLLKRGADPRARNQDGTTAFIAATKWGHKEIIDVLQKYVVGNRSSDPIKKAGGKR